MSPERFWQPETYRINSRRYRTRTLVTGATGTLSETMVHTTTGTFAPAPWDRTWVPRAAGAMVEMDWVWRRGARRTIYGARLLSLPTRSDPPEGVSWPRHALAVHQQRVAADLLSYGQLGPTTARRSGVCPTCLRPVVPGEPILAHANAWHHARCLGPQILNPPTCPLCAATVSLGEGYQRGLSLETVHLPCLTGRPARLGSSR